MRFTGWLPAREGAVLFSIQPGPQGTASGRREGSYAPRLPEALEWVATPPALDAAGGAWSFECWQQGGFAIFRCAPDGSRCADVYDDGMLDLPIPPDEPDRPPHRWIVPNGPTAFLLSGP